MKAPSLLPTAPREAPRLQVPRINPVPTGVLGSAACFNAELGFHKAPARSV